MHYIRSFLKWSAHKLSLLLLANAVAVGVPLMALSVHITNPEIIKNWLASTDTYQTIVTQSLDLIEYESFQKEKGSAPIGDTLSENPFIQRADIATAISDTISADFIKTQTEQVIDGLYPWLNKDVSEPSFTFSLKEKQPELAANIGNTLRAQLTALPDCSPSEITASFSVLESLCLPPGIDLSAEIDFFVADLAGQDGLLTDAEWTQEDIIKRSESDGGLNENQLKLIQTGFTGFKTGPYLLLAAGVLSIGILIYSSKTRFRGFSEAGRTIFSGSLFTFVAALFLSQFEGFLTSFIGEVDSSESTVRAARAVFEPVLEVIIKDVASLTAVLSGTTLAIGAFMVGASLLMKGQHLKEESDLLEQEWKKAAERVRVAEIKRLAKEHPKKYAHLTRDPKTNKKLKGQKTTVSDADAKQIAQDPKIKSKPIADINKDS